MKEETQLTELLKNHYNSNQTFRFKQSPKKIRTRRQKREINSNKNSNSSLSSHPLYIETLIVIDKSVINYYRDFDSESYILTLLNIVSILMKGLFLFKNFRINYEVFFRLLIYFMMHHYIGL